MAEDINRRDFIKKVALGAVTASAAYPAPGAANTVLAAQGAHAAGNRKDPADWVDPFIGTTKA
ncbi:MAG TPA: twin-arginine translocation signal domain-containing protein, partial [Terriglobia bacterium]|nr:twin-arginine translocation signal domain-containing protein [Terriglobia bacterium]